MNLHPDPIQSSEKEPFATFSNGSDLFASSKTQCCRVVAGRRRLCRKADVRLQTEPLLKAGDVASTLIDIFAGGFDQQ